MKKMFTLFLFLVCASNYFPQNEWNLVWSLHEKPFQPPQTGSEMAIVKAGFDTDEDGFGEFLCAYTDLTENYLLMYEATGDNTYDLVWYWKFPVPANTFAGIAVGDIDNNGKVDIVVTMPSQTILEPNPPRLWVFEWNGVVGENKYGNYTGEEFVPTNSWNFGVEDNIDFRPYSLTIEDIDNDGMNELIAGIRQGSRGREVIVASVAGELSGFGAWQIEYNLQGLTGGSLYSVTTGDLDNDGNKEIYAFIWNFFGLYIIECTGPDQYELVNSLETVFQSTGIDYGGVDAIRVADVNGDGVNEMYIAATEADNSIFMITDVTDVSAITADDIKKLMTIPVKAGGKLRSLYIADPDKDGNLDLMIGGETNGQVFDLEYKGEGDPADSASWNLYIAFDMFEYSGIAPEDSPTISPRIFYGHPASDMDGDGLDEYVFINYRTSFSTWEGDGYVWMIEINENATSIDDQLNGLPTEFVLSNNFPNPFNPSTTIQYSIPKASQISLRVFDALGREVKILVDEFKEAGNYTINFDASNIPSGVYFYTISAGEFAQTKKMILMK
jgi:hypothetical protein